MFHIEKRHLLSAVPPHNRSHTIYKSTSKKTGRNESSILTLTRDCLQEVDGRFILWYEKNRGAARKYKKTIDNEGQFSPVALIKTLLKVTEPLVKYATVDDKNIYFWD